jgi:hypothetical protein
MQVLVTRCGHPTALWPWCLLIDGKQVLQPNGTAWRLKKEAEAAGRLIASGQLATHRIRQKSKTMKRSQLMTVAGKGSRHYGDIAQTWALIRSTLSSPR